MRLDLRRLAVLASLLASTILPACVSAQTASALPDRVLVGYWHNWRSATTVTLAAVPVEYDVVNIAFATPTTPGGATMGFTPDRGIYASPQAFIADVRKLQARGVKVLISIGGANDPVHVKSAADAASFAASMKSIITTYGFDGLDIDLEGSSLSLGAGDTDFRAPKTPGIVHFIAGVKSLLASLPQGAILTAAPETAFVQGGYSAYAGIWGAYLPVLHALRGHLTYVHVQHYNTGSMFGRDGKIYTPATPDFHVAMAEMLLMGFKVRGSNAVFPPLRPDQVAIGLPASKSAAGSGYTAPHAVHQALDYLYLGQPFGGKYVLARPGGYPRFRGLMTWSVNWDLVNRREFATNHGPYLSTVFLRADAATFSAKTGGVVNFALRGGRGNARRYHVLAASLAGTQPGVVLPGVTVPLNPDPLTALVLSGAVPGWFQGFTGSLDGVGEATAKLVAPPLPGATGNTVHLAYVLANPWDFASDAVKVTIAP